MSLLQQRWRSRQLVGDAKHALIVRLRLGHFLAGFHVANRIDNGQLIRSPLIYGSNHLTDCFKKIWTADTPWRELPNIQSVKWSRSFDVQTGGERGAATCTIVMDNINFIEVAGPGGVYHAIDRGYFSPSRGLPVGPRPVLWTDQGNEWQNVLNGGWQVEVWEGYGAGADVQLRDTPDSIHHSYAPASGALTRTFTGVITVCDVDSHPDQITITAQDFTVFLTDERLAGWNAALDVSHPVTFANRKSAQGQLEVVGPYTFSDGKATTASNWISDGHSSANPSPLPWYQLKLTQGHYEEFYVVAPKQMTMYVSLNLDGAGVMDGETALPAGWVTLSGPGTGTIDGIPYMRQITLPAFAGNRWSLGHAFDVPEGSHLRLTFGDLYLGTDHAYHAATNDVLAYLVTGASTADNTADQPDGTPGGGALSVTPGHGWVLVEDAIDVVRTILIWAGFAEWVLENFGWSLFQPRLYGLDKYHMDVITDMLTQGAFVFYMGPPTDDDRSIGVPHFEHVNMLDPPKAGTIEVRDTDMTESLSVKWDLSNLPDNIRYAGAISEKGERLLHFGVEGLTRRFRAEYFPPWSASFVGVPPELLDPADANPDHGPIFRGSGSVPRDASINRMFTETMGSSVQAQLNSDEECLMACLLAAIDYAINMATVQFQIPGVAPLNLNDQIAVVDEAAAINSRVWITAIESEHVTGGGEQPGHWRMTVSGALMDTEDMQLIKQDYATAYTLAQAVRGRVAGAVAL